MILYLNGNPQNFDTGFSLLDILRQEKLDDKKGIAVAVNNEVISRACWPDFTLYSSDQITLITATQGG